MGGAGQFLQNHERLWIKDPPSLSSKPFGQRQAIQPASPSAFPHVGPKGENTVTCGNQEEVEFERDSEAQTGLRRSTAEAEWPQARSTRWLGKALKSALWAAAGGLGGGVGVLRLERQVRRLHCAQGLGDHRRFVFNDDCLGVTTLLGEASAVGAGMAGVGGDCPVSPAHDHVQTL